jgi:hypothetical protein
MLADQSLKPLDELASDKGTQSVVMRRYVPVDHASFDPNRIGRLAKDDQQFIVLRGADGPKGTARSRQILTFDVHQVGVGWDPLAARVTDAQPRFRVLTRFSATFQDRLRHGETRPKGFGVSEKCWTQVKCRQIKLRKPATPKLPKKNAAVSETAA